MTARKSAQKGAQKRARGATQDEPADSASTSSLASDILFADPEPPQRSTGWRHLPEERWTADEIHPLPYNAKVRAIAPAKRAKLKRGLKTFGMAGTFNVRKEDGLLIGAHQRFSCLRELIEEAREEYGYDADGLAAELERLGVAGGLFRVSPILGIPDAEAAALSILLNNREAQGDFDAMGLAEVLSELDGHGFDIVETGFDTITVESLVTWEPDDTREGGAKAQGAEPPAPSVSTNSRKKVTPSPAGDAANKSGTSNKTEGAEQNGENSHTLPFDAADLTLAARALYRLADAEPSSADTIRDAAARITKGADVLATGPLTFAGTE